MILPKENLINKRGIDFNGESVARFFQAGKISIKLPPAFNCFRNKGNQGRKNKIDARKLTSHDFNDSRCQTISQKSWVKITAKLT